METIGDAYMVVGGVPDPDPAHAQQVGRLALGMQTESAQVISPLTRQSIQVCVHWQEGGGGKNNMSKILLKENPEY